MFILFFSTVPICWYKGDIIRIISIYGCSKTKRGICVEISCKNVSWQQASIAENENFSSFSCNSESFCCFYSFHCSQDVLSLNCQNLIDMSVLQQYMYPSLESFCLKTSLAASLMAFSGVTRVRLTAAPVESATVTVPTLVHRKKQRTD